jgi:mRNA interferase MazF
MRPIVLVRLDKARPALALTRGVAWARLTRLTVAPLTSPVRGLSTEVGLAPANGLDHACVASCDNIITVPKTAVLRQIGHLLPAQELELTRAI